MRRLGLLGLLLSFLLAPAAPASAAGGAHIVDDSEPETPGKCHLESWVTLFTSGDGYVNEAPACTTKKIPWLEIGAAYQHFWGPTLSAPLFGPQMKVNFQSVDRADFGFGLGLNGGMNLKTGDFATGSTIALLTYQVTDKVRANVNAGWSYLVTADVPNAFFYGGQFEIDVHSDVQLMMEAFGRQPGFPGLQMGLRYTPNKGPVDIDLLVANYFDAATTRFFTVGVTVRF